MSFQTPVANPAGDGTDKTTHDADSTGYAPWSPATYDISTRYFPVKTNGQ